MTFSEPQNNIKQLGLAEGMSVADFGAGSGFYSIEAAKKVKESGKVYVVDIQKDLLDRVKNLAKKERLANIEIIWGDIEKVGGSKLGDLSVDVVIISNVLFQIENKESLLKEISRVLKHGGRVLVIDWTDSFGGMGPAQESIFTEDQVKKLFEEKGFTVQKNIYAGDHHYGVVFS